MATNNSVVTTGVAADKRSFTWKIENFDVVCLSPAFIAAQKFQFSHGDRIGLPARLSCFLQQHSEDKSIGIYFKLLEKPPGVAEVNVSFDVNIKAGTDDDSGKDFFHEIVRLKNLAVWKDGLGFSKLVVGDAKLGEIPLEDGSLIINIDFTLYAVKEEMSVCEKLDSFKTKSLEQLSKDLGQGDTLLGNTSTNLGAKIISKDNVEFPVNRGILAARSAVFHRMFETRMSEAETGEVRIDDLSGKTINVLLGYIYAGTLHQDWKSAEVIEELTCAAHRYGLGLLTEFLDDVLGSVFQMENAKRLLILAKKLGMKKAEVELFAYVKNNATSLEDIPVE